MESAEKISITMTPAMMRAIRASVEAGEYASTSEAVRDAVRIWQRGRDEHAERIAAIKARIHRSVEDPRPSLTIDAVRDRLASLHDETMKARQRGAA
jgi:antitoxin ParD1/3/4